MVGDVVASAKAFGALDALLPEALDLLGGHLAKRWGQGVARLQLATVDEERAWATEPIAMVVEVAKELQAPVVDGWLSVRGRPFEPRDVLVDELGGGRVVAHDDEAGRCRNAFILP